MLSSVLNSEQAIEVNIAIVRAFVGSPRRHGTQCRSETIFFRCRLIRAD